MGRWSSHRGPHPLLTDVDGLESMPYAVGYGTGAQKSKCDRGQSKLVRRFTPTELSSMQHGGLTAFTDRGRVWLVLS